MTDPLAPLRQRFRVRAGDDLVRFRRLVSGDRTGEELRLLVHNLAGAAGTFGYGPLSAAAMAIDDCYASGAPPDETQIALLDDRLSEVAHAQG